MKKAVDACVCTDVCKHLRVFAHTCTSWGEPLKKKNKEMAESKARCQEKKQSLKMKGRRRPPTLSRSFRGVGGLLMAPICRGWATGATTMLGPRG